MAASGPTGLFAVETWIFTNGTLTSAALSAIFGECESRWGGPSEDCGEAVEAGTGPFRIVPADARKEFAFLYGESCPPERPANECIQRIRSARLFRALPRAQLQPRPMQMNQGERTHFTAKMVNPGNVQGRSGMPTDEGVQQDASAPGGQRVVALIPYTARMCFVLKAENPKLAKIEPDPQEGVQVQDGKLCMDVSEGGSAIKYNPSWWITPLTRADLRLFLDMEHYVNGVRRIFPYEPRPFTIDVIPKKSWWERLDAFLEHATGTVNLLTKLATALGALFTVVIGWQIWMLFKRKRSGAPPRRRRRRNDDG